ncbi:hypothetical protein GC387_17380 [Pseudomonas sp. MWU12-2323]|nr:hypothetical protein [Pseudomonas sp. MWU12-2323]
MERFFLDHSIIELIAKRTFVEPRLAPYDTPGSVCDMPLNAQGPRPPYCCSGLMKPDIHLGENARQIEVSDDQATSFLFR